MRPFERKMQDALRRESEYNGWTNWETWNTALTIDNEQPTYIASREFVKRGAPLHEFENWAIETVIGPHNNKAIADAREWNVIPPEERLDYNYEALKDKSPAAAEAVNNLGFGPDISDSKPQLIDPSLVNWQEIYDNYRSEYGEEEQPQQEQQLQPQPQQTQAPVNPDQPGDTTFPTNWTAQ